MAKCEHGRQRSVCKDCGGGSICEHSIVRGTCSICSPDLVFRAYQRKAADRGIPFALTEDKFREIVQRPCVFCGEWGYPRGVDRRDNFKGYVPDNCQSCCGPCNFLKRAENQHTFLGLIFKIARYQEKLRRTEHEKQNGRVNAGGAGESPCV